MLGVLALVACSPTEGPTFTTRQDASTVTPMTDGAITPTRDAIPIPDRGTVVIAEDASCATTTADARRLPVNLLIVLDRSGSMSSGMPSRWSSAVRGLQTLLMGLDDDVRVGLTMFPSTSGSADSAAGYTRPLVAVDALRTNRARLVSSLSSASPNGNTPMTCAMEGTRSYYEAFTSDGSRNVILITDGAPTQECTTASICFPNPLDIGAFIACQAEQERVASDAVRVSVARGARGAPPIRYFVAGTPSANNTFLSDLAFTGNSPREPGCQGLSTCHYSLGDGSFEADLARALDDIRGRATSCEFEVDADPSVVDPTRVNVDVSSGGMSSVIPRDVDHDNGWDYSAGMRSVILYGPACQRITSDKGAEVRIVFGCPTQTPG